MLACSLGLVLVAAACGGGDEESASDDFVAQADEICTNSQRELVGVVEDLGPLESPEDEAERVSALNPIREQTLADLQALEPPEELSADYEEYVALREERLANDKKVEELLQKGDVEAVGKISARNDEVTKDAEAKAEEIGFSACAQVLPAEAEAQVKETIDMLEISDDPALCTETMTASGVEVLFGSLEKCEKTQEELKPSELADSVDYEEIKGVEGVTANVIATVEGGALDGQRSSYQLLFEDGTYKVSEVFAAEE